MKRIITLALIGLLLLCGACAQPAPPASTTQPPEPPEPGSPVLAVSFDYQRQSGSASNQFAVWIEDMEGNLVKTLAATAYTAKGGYKVRPDSISTWVGKALDVSDFDAVATATPRKNTTFTCTWDGLDETGNAVPPGTYRFVVEGTLRWKNYVLYTGLLDFSGESAQGVPEFFFAGEGRQPALDEDAPECGMITNVKAEYIA